MNRNSKVIKGIGVVALSGVVATSALTMTSCGKKTSKADSIVITLADEENNGADCLSSTWLPLSQITTNSDFRESFNTLTHNRTSNQKKEGTIYYLENPTLATSLKNSAFVSIFDNLNSSELLSLVSDLYLDLDETTSPDILKAAVINTYFDLFNTKQSQSQNEFNATQRISRVDFISAVVKSTTSPQSNEENISESEIMSKLSDKSYLGNNTTNNTETGIITKAEAAYMIASCMFNSEMKEVKADKPAENLQSCLESGELSSDLKEAMSILENKGIISDESFVGSWNKALTKSEAIDLIYNGLKVKGSLDGGAVNEDVIAEEEAARLAALAEKKETAHVLIGGYSRISLDEWNEKIEAAETEEEVDEIVSRAGVEESDAIEAEKAAAAAKKSSGKKKIATTNGGGNGGGGTSSTTPAGGGNSGSSDFELPPGVTLSDPNDWTGWGGDDSHSNDDFGHMGYGF